MNRMKKIFFFIDKEFNKQLDRGHKMYRRNK